MPPKTTTRPAVPSARVETDHSDHPGEHSWYLVGLTARDTLGRRVRADRTGHAWAQMGCPNLDCGASAAVPPALIARTLPRPPKPAKQAPKPKAPVVRRRRAKVDPDLEQLLAEEREIEERTARKRRARSSS